MTRFYFNSYTQNNDSDLQKRHLKQPETIPILAVNSKNDEYFSFFQAD